MSAAARPIMADVARLAGVSTMTVSRVLNDHPNVTDATRQRVERAIEQLGYRPNTAARTLAGGRSATIGVVSVETPYYGPASPLFGIEQAHSSRLATRHLLELGHQTVHHVRGSSEWFEGDARFDAWVTELRAHGIEPPPALHGDWTPASGYEAGRTLAADPGVRAIFA